MINRPLTWLRRGALDPVAEQLRDLERQGAGMARLAHLAAFALVLVFSAGSLVALSGEALTALLDSATRGALDVPAAVSIAVSTLLVVAMDMALLVAAATVRMLRLRRQEGAALHVAVIVGVSVVEASTYAYMSYLYDRPASWAVWALIAARALSAPLVAVYLSLARSLPVSARDILAQVELATGRGVVRDMVRIAGDSAAPLERKLSLYSASSVMTPEDSARLAALIAVEQATRAQEIPDAALAGKGQYTPLVGSDASAEQATAAGEVAPPDEPPDGPGSGLPPVIGERPSHQVDSGLVTPFRSSGRPRPKPAAIRRRDAEARRALEVTRRRRAWAMIESQPGISANALAKALHCRHATAQRFIRSWQTSQRQAL